MVNWVVIKMNSFRKIFIAFMFMIMIPNLVNAAGSYYNMVDDSGKVVYVTGWKIRVGDEFLTGDNKRYEITSIEGQTAKVKFIGAINLVEYSVANRDLFAWGNLLKLSVVNAQAPKKVALYHTHNDEAYIPSDGTESMDKGEGGIVKVGNVFTKALENNGIVAIHADTNHSPHDNMAYERSRRTVVSLLKQQPDAIFDLHRDAAPPEAYGSEINGEAITQVQFVVGKYGPTGKQAEEYALQMKAASDNQHPGLVKGIFFAKGGDYNQDLHPKSMLVEVGAHTNSREEAERGIAMFADVIPTVLGVTSANDSNINGAAGIGTTTSGPSGSTKSIAWIIGILVAGVILFMFLSTGSMREAKAKFKNFTSREFTNFFGLVKLKKNNKNDDNRRKK